VRSRIFPSVLLVPALLISCTTTTTSEGFDLVQLDEWPDCHILSYDGEPVRRTATATGRPSMWGLGRCPKTHPDFEDTSIWVQRNIETGPHVATMTTKPREDGTYQRVTIRRGQGSERPGYFRYIWVRHG